MVAPQQGYGQHNLALATVQVFPRPPRELLFKLVKIHWRVKGNDVTAEIYEPVSPSALLHPQPELLGPSSGGLLSGCVALRTRAT